MTRLLTLLIPAALFASATVQAAEILAPASERFAKADIAEVPEFRKHVVPLLSKLGCNGRACHGSFQGQGGFRLSLFGYDFKMDHDGLSERLDLDDPTASYALQKPMLIEPHEGGKRLEADSWEYRILLNWIKDGAKSYNAESQADFVKLHVEPQEILFHNAGETAQLKVVVEWNDGVKEDVTHLCRYQSNNDAFSTIDSKGLVTSVEPGDTHVVVFYDNGVTPIPVIRPLTDKYGKNYPQIASKTKIDELVVNKLSKMGIVPSDVCGDSEFLRRVSLDLTGTLPTADEVKQFVADSTPDKREKKIDELLERPGYAAWWTTKLSDYTGNNNQLLNNVLPNRDMPGTFWYEWIHSRVEQNVPYDQIIEGIVVSNSQDKSESYADYTSNMTKIMGDENHKFADRDSMPFFWARRNVRQPEEKALSFAYSFMGIRIQCAQCHKHPFDQWTQDDYNQFTNFFTRVQYGRNPDNSKEYNAMMADLGVDKLRGGEQRRKLYQLAREGKAVPLQEVYVREMPKQSSNRKNRKARNNNRLFPQTAKLLGDEEVNLEEAPDPRAALMQWLRGADNPYFAKAFVNRVWSNYFNVGIVEPPDDLNLANPPSNAELLDWLAAEFRTQKFDMKWLHRTICNSDAYQRSWQPNETNQLDERNFSRAIPRRLPAEVAYDALLMATANDQRNASAVHDLDKRAIALTSTSRNYALDIFGRSTRESNCDCDRSMEASLLQTIYLRNDTETQKLLEDKNGWVAQVVAELNPNKKQARNDDAPNDKQSRRLKLLATQLEKSEDRLAEMKQRQPDNPKIKQAEKRLDQMRADYKKERKRLGVDEKPVAKTEPVKPAEFDAEHLVTRAYLRTLSRYPNSEEMGSASEYLRSSDDLADGLEGLMWALLNTKEFIVNH